MIGKMKIVVLIKSGKLLAQRGYAAIDHNQPPAYKLKSAGAGAKAARGKDSEGFGGLAGL
jgi:hypothetical protein